MNGASAAAGVVVRPARPEDLAGVVDLLVAVAAEGRWIGTEAPVDREARLAWFRQALDHDGQALFVALAGGEVVGQLGLELRPYRVADLGMAVAARWRGRGVGSRLLQAGVEWARSVGSHKVSLQVWPHNRAARNLYRKFGFVEEGVLRRHYPRRNGQLWDAVIMGLVLDETTPGSPFGDGEEPGDRKPPSGLP